MSDRTIESLYADYSAALDWALQLTGRSAEENRFMKYKKVIKKELDDYQAGLELKSSNNSETKEVAEALLEASVLIEVHKKFLGNSNKYFKDKLKDIFDGEYYASDEPVGSNSYARDTQAELIMASKCIDPTKLSFWGNDIVYNFESFKFGIEVKRINSDLVRSTFKTACDQIQNKRTDVSYGLVALCMDRFLFFNERPGILLTKPMLLPRQSWMIKARTKQNLIAINKEQLQNFHAQYGNEMLEIALEFPKVTGYCVYLYHPAMVGVPGRLIATGYAEHVLWDSSENPNRKSAFARFMKEQFYSDSFVNHLENFELMP